MHRDARVAEPSWLSPDLEPTTFARTVASVLARLPAEPELAARCRAHAAAYDWPGIVEQYERLYRSLRAPS